MENTEGGSRLSFEDIIPTIMTGSLLSLKIICTVGGFKQLSAPSHVCPEYPTYINALFYNHIKTESKHLHKINTQLPS